MRGDFAKAYGKYRRGGGELDRKEFGRVWWPQIKKENVKVDEVEEIKESEE